MWETTRVSIRDALYSKVLIAEDDHAQLRRLIDIVEGAGFQAVACADLQALRQQLLAGSFGIAVVDLKFAELFGVDVMHLIKQTHPSARIIIYTAQGTYEFAKDAINLGAFAFVERNGDTSGLIEHVRRAANELLLEALQESEQTFRKLAENIDAAFWMRSVDGRVEYVSPKCELIWGIASVGLIRDAHLFVASVIEEDRPRFSEALRQLSAEANPVNFDLEYRIRRPDGDMIWVRDRSFSVCDDQGILLRHAGLAEDITMRKRLEQVLRESEQRFRTIFEQAAVGVALIETPTGRYVRVNERYAATIGYGVDELLGKTFMEFTAPHDLPDDLRNMEKLKAGEISEFAKEKRLIHKNGAVMWVHVTVSPTWKNGECATFHIAIVEDITVRKNIEKALRESERSLAKAQQIAKIGSWEFDLGSGHMTGSSEMFRIIGVSNADLVAGFGDFIENFVDARDRKLMLDSYFGAMETGVIQPIEFRLLKAPAKELRYGRCEAEFVRDEKGVPRKIIGTLQDITKQRIAAEEHARLLEELAHVGRLSTMGEMVAGIAHELNQPLYAITNFSEACTNTLLRSQQLEIDRVLTWTKEISKQSTRAGQIIQRLGEFVRKDKPRRSMVDINELIRESAELLSFEARRQQIDLEFLLYEPVPLVMADRIQIQQVIVNLLRNAYEALSANDRTNRRAVVSTRCVGNIVTIIVQDNGPGISPDDVEKIFEPFYSTKQQGMGMGLAISKSILETHNSSLAVRSKETETIFEFRLAARNGGGQA